MDGAVKLQLHCTAFDRWCGPKSLVVDLSPFGDTEKCYRKAKNNLCAALMTSCSKSTMMNVIIKTMCTF